MKAKVTDDGKKILKVVKMTPAEYKEFTKFKNKALELDREKHLLVGESLNALYGRSSGEKEKRETVIRIADLELEEAKSELAERKFWLKIEARLGWDGTYRVGDDHKSILILEKGA